MRLSETQQDRLFEAICDLTWKATQYGTTEDGDTYAYILPKGTVHRLVGLMAGLGHPAPLRNEQVIDCGCTWGYLDERCDLHRYTGALSQPSKGDVFLCTDLVGEPLKPTEPVRCPSLHARYGQCQLLAGHPFEHRADVGAEGPHDGGHSWLGAVGPTEQEQR